MINAGNLKKERMTESSADRRQTSIEWLAVMDSQTTGKQLGQLAAGANTVPALLERIAEHSNAPQNLLKKLATHTNPDVRSAVVENTRVTEKIILLLCEDESPDVRFRVAENHNVSTSILEKLINDNNPYVAERAKKTLGRLQAPFSAVSKTVPQDEIKSQSNQREGPKIEKKLSVLVIEDNPADVKILQIMLTDWPFELMHADRLSTGLKFLEKNPVDVILLDLTLPDSQGIETFYQMHCSVPQIPILVLTGLEDESIGSEAVQSGAQDYLVKGQVLPGMLGRSIKYAVERQDIETKIKHLNETLEQRVIQLAAINQELDKLSQSLAASCEQAMQTLRVTSVPRNEPAISSPLASINAMRPASLIKALSKISIPRL